MTMRNKVSNWN